MYFPQSTLLLFNPDYTENQNLSKINQRTLRPRSSPSFDFTHMYDKSRRIEFWPLTLYPYILAPQ